MENQREEPKYMLQYFEKDIQKIVDTVKLEEKLPEEEQPV